MAALSGERIGELIEDFYPAPSSALISQLSAYLDLLLKWNARTNLTAVRDPEEIVSRHFGESLFLARHLPPCRTLLDLGSGAGFPGIPIQLVLPHLEVTLSESQNKKAAFLREAVRSLGLPSEVWGARVEDMPAGRLFHVVALRAVDNPGLALSLARQRLSAGGVVAHLAAGTNGTGTEYAIPGSLNGVLRLLPQG